MLPRNVQFSEEKKVCISTQDGSSIQGKDLAKEEVISDQSVAESKTHEENTRPRRYIKLPAKLNDCFYMKLM